MKVTGGYDNILRTWTVKYYQKTVNDNGLPYKKYLGENTIEHRGSIWYGDPQSKAYAVATPEQKKATDFKFFKGKAIPRMPIQNRTKENEPAKK